MLTRLWQASSDTHPNHIWPMEVVNCFISFRKKPKRGTGTCWVTFNPSNAVNCARKCSVIYHRCDRLWLIVIFLSEHHHSSGCHSPVGPDGPRANKRRACMSSTRWNITLWNSLKNPFIITLCKINDKSLFCKSSPSLGMESWSELSLTSFSNIKTVPVGFDFSVTRT